MKIRAKLVLAFFLLAVLPLTGIVLYSYFASTRAVRATVEREAQGLTADMEVRMAAIGSDLKMRVEQLGTLPFRRLLGARSEAEKEALLGRMLSEMGDAAPLVESFELVPVPAAPLPPAAHRPPAAPDVPVVVPLEAPEVAEVEEVVEMESIFFEVSEEIRARHQELELQLQVLTGAETGMRFGLEIAAALAEATAEQIEQQQGGPPENPETETERAARGQNEAERDAEIARYEAQLESWARQQERQAMARHRAERRAERRRAPAERGPAERGPAERGPAEDRGRPPRLFARGLEVPVREEGRLVGQVKTKISAEQLLRQVLRHTRRDQGEIPYALDAEGRLFVADEADRQALEGLDLERSGVTDEAVTVYSTDPESGVGFGIVRPIKESLAEIQRAAGRNFAYGLGLIGLALLGILPLSRRMTRDLAALTAGAERVASGDLTTRVPVRSGDELGQLAGRFNDMALDLSRQQERLLAEERRRRDEEIERQLLEAEYRRKSRELEEARQFQLSLLPRNLPRHPSFEVAVHMQTANEVGGDYYDFHLAENGTLTAAVGDATGHGARAGTMVTAVKSLFSAYASGAGLSRFLINANRTVRRMDLGRMSMGLVLAELRHGTLTVSAAGMPPVLVCRCGSREAGPREIEELEVEGMPLGGLEFAYREERRELSPGDTVLMMSDGLPELLDPEGELMGYAEVRRRFAAAAHQPPEEIVAELAAAVPQWTGDEPPNDDVTFVVVRVVETS